MGVKFNLTLWNCLLVGLSNKFIVVVVLIVIIIIITIGKTALFEP
jgi:hypothetical protein